jgi:hypothetical protein
MGTPVLFSNINFRFEYFKHLSAQPNLFSSLTSTLFNLLLFGAPQHHWAVIKPMLSLMLASESSFKAYKDHLIATQAPRESTKSQ